ncbi:TMV resistance protein N-like [Ipomoea triloba]|uniref:TMV resistance protein N-like n=1 Tax=Ipomoea triloba TaxID=35885 RepID=UPI00125D0114|nr:TMV resistance protein N-like [Ipomoea triloba]
MVVKATEIRNTRPPMCKSRVNLSYSKLFRSIEMKENKTKLARVRTYYLDKNAAKTLKYRRHQSELSCVLQIEFSGPVLTIAMEQPSFVSSSCGSSYDVFLSFRGEDVRKNFVDHLYGAIQQRGIYIFKDDEKLERGKSISPALEKAIEESSMAVVVFSEHYADSTWCLEELVKIMECMEVKGQMVVPIFYGVDPSTVRKQKGKFGEAFEGHEKTFEKEGEKVKKWRRVHEAKFIQKIVEDIMTKLGSTRSIDDPKLVGIEARMQKLYRLIGLESNDVRFVGIHGMSGIGKTTIARALYDKISMKFEGSSFIHEVRSESSKHGVVHLQQKLLSQILSVKDLKIDNVFEGKMMIQQRLRCKRVLIVLDDVDHRDQLETFVGNSDWFGVGSRIIITTKDKHLLISHKVSIMKYYKVGVLEEAESFQLFRQHAFNKQLMLPPTKEFEEVEAQVVHYAGGLPLALEVFGSLLYGRDIDEWRSEVGRLKEIPEDEILEKLKVSFIGLNKNTQRVFLDIACFFNGKKRTTITRILNSFNFHSDIGIKVLREKSLITISEGRVLMHQLIQEMGWSIVRQEALDDPKRYSRLWLSQDISQLLIGSEGTVNIQGIAFNLPVATDVKVSSEAFTHMAKLRLVKFHNVNASQAPNFLPGELRWLDWHGYPSKSLPATFEGQKLVSLKMQYSRVIQLWKGFKVLDNLKFMNLSHSQKLIRTPDFTGIPILETLILEECTSLVEIHASVGFLKNLVSLNLKDCVNLKRLPDSIHLEKLEIMILSGCFKLENFPKITGPMDCLLEVHAEATAIREVPSSIECLTNLRLIDVSNCKHLASLPISICRLKGVKAVILSGCSKFEKLPDELGEMECLEELYCDKTAIQELPSSISLLKKLKILSFGGCKPTQKSFLSRLLTAGGFEAIKASSPFPSLSGLSSLEKLDLSDCSMLDGGIILGDLRELHCLKVLNLSNNKFGCIPAESFVGLTRLLQLHLVGCGRLQSLPELPSSIIEVYADECPSLEGRSIDSLTKLNTQIYVVFHSLNVLNYLRIHVTGLSNDPNRRISVCFPGTVFPEWFTYKNWGNSLSVSLPQNWYNNKFMGFAFCLVSNFIGYRTSRKYCSITKNYGLDVKIISTARDGRHSLITATMGYNGVKQNLKSGLTCLCYKLLHSSHYNRNEWCQIEVSGYLDSVYTCIGMRLVYEDDVN